MVGYIILLGIIGSIFFPYFIIKIKNIYKVLFLIKNESKIKEDIKRINDDIKKTTDLKEKKKLFKELKKNYELFHITDGEISGPTLAEEQPAPRKYIVNENLLDQFSLAITMIIVSFTMLFIAALLLLFLLP